MVEACTASNAVVPVRKSWFDARSLALGIFGFLLIDQILLVVLLGMPMAAIGAVTLLSVSVCIWLWNTPGWQAGPVVSGKGFAAAFAFALCLFMLGGEGRIFYANTDWQVRIAVLNDLVTHPWPWAYSTPQGLSILRCPIGIYIFPALIGKLVGTWGAELAMLVQNATLLAIILSLGASLFPSGRTRWITLALICGFSGLDVLGQAIHRGNVLAHLEGWGGLQYTAPMTLAFWVPPHAIPGWVGAVFYLLWRAGKLPLRALLTLVPALPLMSPLAAIGVMPFVAVAGIVTLTRKQLSWQDVVVPGCGVVLAVPSLLYLSAGMEGVSTGAAHFQTITYVLFFLFEIMPFLIILWLSRGHWNLDTLTVLVATGALLVLPFGRIGVSTDFMMRASIPSLTILAIVMAGVLQSTPEKSAKNMQAAKRIAICVFLIGLAVPVGEVARAVLLPRAKDFACGYYGVVPNGYSTYIAAYDRLPNAIRPAHPSIIKLNEPTVCWTGPWPDAAAHDFSFSAR